MLHFAKAILNSAEWDTLSELDQARIRECELCWGADQTMHNRSQESRGRLEMEEIAKYLHRRLWDRVLL